MHWREVIYQYLLARLEDAREHLAAAARRREGRYLEEHATASFRERHARIMQALAAKHALPLNSPDGYQVVEERPDLVIVELEAGRNGYPCVQERFRLVRRDESWQLDDIFWKCHCLDGKCFLCDGKRTCRMCGGKGTLRSFWGLVRKKCLLCHGEPTCNHCQGTGLCRYCQNSDMPGWKSTLREL